MRGSPSLSDPNFLHAWDRVHLGYGVFSRRPTNPAIEIKDCPRSTSSFSRTITANISIVSPRSGSRRVCPSSRPDTQRRSCERKVYAERGAGHVEHASGREGAGGTRDQCELARSPRHPGSWPRPDSEGSLAFTVDDTRRADCSAGRYSPGMRRLRPPVPAPSRPNGTVWGATSRRRRAAGPLRIRGRAPHPADRDEHGLSRTSGYPGPYLRDVRL
jgi:hypothetical protein